MSRLLLLFICLTWLAGVGEPVVRSRPAVDAAVILFLVTPVAWVLVVALWSRWLARRVSARTFARSIHRLNWVMLLSRLFVVGWFAAGVFAFGWVDFVQTRLHLSWFGSARLPGLLVGIAPALLMWIGLWWGHFPADRALRQQGLTENLLEGVPVHAPLGLGAYLATHIRLQILFTLVPLMLIAGVRDLGSTAVAAYNKRSNPAIQSTDASPVVARTNVRATPTHEMDAGHEPGDELIWLLSAGLVFVLAPEVLRRILPTSPLPDGPLRRRLEAMCRRSGMRYRNILVWHTHFNVGNAAVMGLFPRFRYILLSDLLLERMDDEQIEAVFAHEVGHVVHRHMGWYIVFFLSLIFVAAVLGSLSRLTPAGEWLDHLPLAAEVWAMGLLTASALGFWLLFGFLSRRFERQADVYAARMLELTRPADAAAGAAVIAPLVADDAAAEGRNGKSRDLLVRRPTPVESHVGTYGAQLFASALHRVAMINNLPVNPRSRRGGGLMNQVSYMAGNLMDLAYDWLHGSIANRMAYLRNLSRDPALTSRFDRLMGRLYGTLLFVLIASAAYVVPSLVR